MQRDPDPGGTGGTGGRARTYDEVRERLRGALAGWSERNLDRVQLQHPLLGTITARVLVFFTIYHGPHHLTAVKRRLDDESDGHSAPIDRSASLREGDGS